MWETFSGLLRRRPHPFKVKNTYVWPYTIFSVLNELPVNEMHIQRILMLSQDDTCIHVRLCTHELSTAGHLALPSSREAVLEYIVERKRMDDLAGSIIDGRFHDQKVCSDYVPLNIPQTLCF